MKDVNYLKVNGFNVDSVLDSLGDMEMYDEILGDFVNEGLVNKLVNYKNENDMTNYSIIVHNLKGECLYLGIERLANMAYEHQLKSEANDMVYINTNFNTLLAELQRVLEVAKTYLGM
ncbi:MAG: hypothetical protein IJ399_02180 [Bacilli bacterium]|nr:hypothetical protein [Bacilli bacterium]